MKRDWRELLERTHLRYWGIGFVLLLLVILSLTINLPATAASQGELFTHRRDVALASGHLPVQPATPTPSELTQAAPTHTPFPAELLGNYKQTTGVIIVASLLVLIIVGGVFFQLIHERNTPG
jgi:Na+-transporting methylmalonyl-CoA/oxaloacetate decarboxylase gamma subunit